MTTTTSTASTTPASIVRNEGRKYQYAETDMGHPGLGPFRYRHYFEPELSEELARQSSSRTHDLGGNSSGTSSVAYSVSLQPCCNPEALSQDRLSVESWEINGGQWTFAAVFDGHGGHDTVDYALSTLPSEIHRALSLHLSYTSSQSSTSSITSKFTTTSTNSTSTIEPELISTLLAATITTFDDNITKAFLSLFTGGEAQVAGMSDDEINELVNDQEKGGGANAAIVARCMRGSTALVALVDPAKENLWIVNLGDCVAVLGEIDDKPPSAVDTKAVKARQMVLNALHNGSNKDELDRVELEHPGEPECVLRKRVLGALAVTRALGDHTFKLPKVYTERVFLHARNPYKSVTPMTEVLPRIRAPPYVSNVPEVRHVALNAAFHGGALSTASVDTQAVDGAEASASGAHVAEPPPTPLRDDDDPDPVLEQSEVGFDVEVVPPTPKTEDKEAKFIDDSDTESDGDSHYDAVAERQARNTEYGSMVGGTGSESKKRFLILASDGLQYLYNDMIEAQSWANTVGHALAGKKGSDSKGSTGLNPALALLRDALGGDDDSRVSSMLTVELEDRWMDDTTIVVVPL